MRPTYDIPAVKRLILERLSAGQTLAQLEATPGFPSAPTVRKWAREDAGFAAGLGSARALRRGVRVEQRAAWVPARLPRPAGAPWAGMTDHADAAWGRRAWEAEFVARLRRGELMGSMLGGGGGQPSRAMVRAWRRERPDFDAAVAAAVRAWRGGARRGRADYDEATADRVVLARAKGATMAEIHADPAMPGKWIVARWRRLVPEFDGALRIARGARWAGTKRRRANRRLADEALVEAICEHIIWRAGSLRSAARCVAGAPYQGTLYAWRRKHPEFARKVATAMMLRDDVLLDRAAEVADGLDVYAGLGPGALSWPKAQLGALWLRLGQLHAGRKGRG
jgi:hypothetical protein